ncbi:uncharacterized protein B0I36DRAFT_371820 [Microdochium trichocladiopsis]|uniref:Oxysterol-binding protein n=1 Tax=Microdochium trichocladiopsis TaxID=1682393 RepID=A0A9P8YE16_9PEZI|nr:uncharacterized protein B0I36DRAFT_371820 [Microdochium trichocladiopsis]KAH7037157.1 hypothetical protein B0I36DRAFT_371820 [Microdochium trichocladiopsis]
MAATLGAGGLRDFLGYLATVKGDLSNITAPPFLLSPRSVTEMPVACAERQELFLAPAHEDDPEVRALLVLKSFLCSLKRQGYHATIASSPSTSSSSLGGAKKPLNAFLGELFLAKFLPSDNYRRRSISSVSNGRANSVGSDTSVNETTEDDSATLLFVEQVSHHPPATACYTYNKAHGMSSEGYVAQETSFSPTSGVRVSQVGYAIVRDTVHNESHLMTLPTLLLKGLLTGRPYPELDGSCYISSSSGYLATVGFSGTNTFGMGKRNSFNARLCSVREEGDSSSNNASVPANKRQPIYEISGQWTGKMTIKDGRTGKVVEEFDVNDVPISEAQVAPLEKQSPWESRRAWHEVIEGIRMGNMEAIARRKAQIENAQRRMREVERNAGVEWPRMFFHNKQQPILARAIPDESLRSVDPSRTGGVWSFIGIGPAMAILRDGLHFRSLEPTTELDV